MFNAETHLELLLGTGQVLHAGHQAGDVRDLAQAALQDRQLAILAVRQCQVEQALRQTGFCTSLARRFCQLLRDVGYDRWLSLELFREDLWEQDPEAVAREGLEKMKAVAEG